LSEEERREAYRDRDGHLWLRADDPDRAEPGVFCYDAQAARAMSRKWRIMPLAEADAEFGPLLELEALPGTEEDVVLFLAGGGRTLPVPPDWAARRFDWRGLAAQEMIPGYQILLLGQGDFEEAPGRHASGAYVVIRRTR
jgi:hypothetical protein